MESKDKESSYMHAPADASDLRTFKWRVGVAVRAEGEGLALGAVPYSLCVCVCVIVYE